MPWDAVGSGIGAALRAGSGFGERRSAIRVRGVASHACAVPTLRRAYSTQSLSLPVPFQI
jgi:hypothetical protein